MPPCTTSANTIPSTCLCPPLALPAQTLPSTAHAHHTYTPAWHTWGAECAKDRHGLSVLQQGDEWPRVRQVWGDSGAVAAIRQVPPISMGTQTIQRTTQEELATSSMTSLAAANTNYEDSCEITRSCVAA